MHDRRHHSQRTAAARAGFSERTARRIEAGRRLPSEERPRRGRTVPDPLAEVWERELLPILDNDPAVQAVTLLRHLQRLDPDRFPDDRVRRTLERRVRAWRALEDPAKDVVFRQSPEPGRMALSDFTGLSGFPCGRHDGEKKETLAWRDAKHRRSRTSSWTSCWPVVTPDRR
jgi:hypothetical protein